MSLLEVGDILGTFAIPGGLTVTRRAAPTVTAGIDTPGASSTFTVDPICVQPASGRTLQRLPEGERTREAISFWCRTQLRTAVDPAGGYADRIAYAGATYEVAQLGDWNTQGGYYEGVAVKVATS